jgi:hypothetical protein
MTLLKVGAVLGSPMSAAFGISPDFVGRIALRADIGRFGRGAVG